MKESLWPIEEAAKILDAEVVEGRDPRLQAEYRLHPRQAEAQLCLFPQRLVARWRDPYTEIVMRNVTFVGADETREGALRVQATAKEATCTLSMDPAGTIYFTRKPIPSQNAKTEEPTKEAAKGEEQREKLPKVEMVGRLGRDPQIKATKDGQGEWAETSLAVKEGDETKWVDLLFGKKAVEYARSLHKGDLIKVVGGAGEREKTLKTANGPIKKKISTVVVWAVSDPNAKKKKS